MCSVFAVLSFYSNSWEGGFNRWRRLSVSLSVCLSVAIYSTR